MQYPQKIPPWRHPVRLWPPASANHGPPRLLAIPLAVGPASLPPLSRGGILTPSPHAPNLPPSLSSARVWPILHAICHPFLPIETSNSDLTNQTKSRPPPTAPTAITIAPPTLRPNPIAAPLHFVRLLRWFFIAISVGGASPLGSTRGDRLGCPAPRTAPVSEFLRLFP